jgi:hypothetical protein
MEIILKNYTDFIHIIDGYEECLSIVIRNEREYNRKKSLEDAGIRVKTSKVSDITANTAINNIEIKEAIRCGDIETALDGADDIERHAAEIKTLINMREDYRIISNQFNLLKADEHRIFEDYISKRKRIPDIASDEGLSYETIRSKLKRSRRTVKSQARPFLESKYKYVTKK